MGKKHRWIRLLAVGLSLSAVLVTGAGCDFVRPPIPPGATPNPQADPGKPPQPTQTGEHRLRLAAQVISSQPEQMYITWTATGYQGQTRFLFIDPGTDDRSWQQGLPNVPVGGQVTLEVEVASRNHAAQVQCFIFDYSANTLGNQVQADAHPANDLCVLYYTVPA